jgi:hypothetical protein
MEGDTVTDTPETIYIYFDEDDDGIYGEYMGPESLGGDTAYRRDDLPRPEDAVRIAELVAALAEASAAWEAFNRANVSVEYIAAGERLNAALRREGGEG